MWSDEYASRVYKVTILSETEVLFQGVTRRRELVPSPDAWDRIRERGGVLTIRVEGAVIDADGHRTGDIAASEVTVLTIGEAADDPSGMMLFGAKLRPPHIKVGTVPLLMMNLRIDALDLEELEHRVVFRSSYGPEPTKVHPTRAESEGGGGGYGGAYGGAGPGAGGPTEPSPPNEERPGAGDSMGVEGGTEGPGPYHDPNAPEGQTSTQCVSCHAISDDGKYVATFSQAAEEAPIDFDAPNGFLTVLKMPERELIIQLPHAFMPMFNPKNSDLLVYGEVDETIGVKDQQMVRKSDLRVLDLQTGRHRAIPGANLSNRVENFPAWSPDGRRLAFIRTKPGEMWHGAAGHIDIATIDYNGGSGGVAEDLKGASNNGKSNFLPIYSKDGRWIVFTQADQGFFSQETSDLWIVPAEGGEARALSACNSNNTESWHRFSPDGKWLGIVTNREDIRRPHIYLSRFNSQTGMCSPAVQLPVVSGPGAHTHAFTWTKRFAWLDDYERLQSVARVGFPVR
jgi:Tol biopolymer transport system component